MKQALLKFYIFFAVIMFVCTDAFAQKNFEGKITYKFYANSQGKEEFSAIIEAYFSNKKLKLVFKDKENINDDSSMIVDFEKGILYRISLKDSSYSADSLNKLKKLLQAYPVPTQEKKNLLGYNCSAVAIKQSSHESLNDFPTDEKIWYADSLHFLFDTAFGCGDALDFANGNSISLMQEQKMNVFDTINISFGMIAIAVKEIKVPGSIFNIPAGFLLKEKPFEKPGIKVIDIQMAEVKKGDSPPPPPPPPPPSLPTKKKHKKKKVV